jgi:hypothetical protein
MNRNDCDELTMYENMASFLHTPANMVIAYKTPELPIDSASLYLKRARLRKPLLYVTLWDSYMSCPTLVITGYKDL